MGACWTPHNIYILQNIRRSAQGMVCLGAQGMVCLGAHVMVYLGAQGMVCLGAQVMVCLGVGILASSGQHFKYIYWRAVYPGHDMLGQFIKQFLAPLTT